MSAFNSAFLKTNLASLCRDDEVCNEACSKFLRLGDFTETDFEKLFDILSSLLLCQKQTLTVACHMIEILPHILALSLRDQVSKSLSLHDTSSKLLHEKRCVALSKLSLAHPDVMMYALKYFKDNPSPFHYRESLEIDEEPGTKKRKLYPSYLLTPVSAIELADCCYLFLEMKTDYFRSLWDWSGFLKQFLNHTHKHVQWVACQCLALLFKMGSHNLEMLLTTKFSLEEIVDFKVDSSFCKKAIKMKFSKSCLDEPSVISSSLPEFERENVIFVAGIALPLSSQVAINKTPSLVLVSSTLSNLQAIALGIATGNTLCLQGPVGCGKTALVEYLAGKTGRHGPPHFLSIQLGDQTDSKMLLGTYQCTEIPGEFVWKPGVLTQAIMGGFWLLLEDIDSCSTDVAAVLATLLETGSLSVPGFKDCVHAAPGFQLFFTQRLMPGAVGLHKLHTGVTSMLQKHWLTVQMEPLSECELVNVIQTLHPSLATVASRMVDVFLLFSAGSHHTSLMRDKDPAGQEDKTIKRYISGARLPSTRDLMKWCNRSSQTFNASSTESGLRLFQDAIDIFCCNVSAPAKRLLLAENIAAKLGIIHTKAEYFCNVYKPVISLTSSHIVTGRVSLPKKESEKAFLPNTVKATFSFTRPASALLERIATCIHYNEPVLLVGETGVGKTSSIQYLAQQMGQSLFVINMNQHSDSADLLGGFKPVELKIIISPIREEFENLFRNFFSDGKNAKFLNHIATCFSLKKWSKLLELMKYSTSAALKRFDKNQPRRESSKEDTHGQILYLKWLQLSTKLQKVEEQLKKSQNALAFSFIEGSLVRALKQGYWVLLDEINLASAQTLECLSSLLEGATGSLYLLERGDKHSITRHTNFRIFAAMNPATDVGKKELPPGIRNRFTEFYVDELVDRQDLLLLCSSYLVSLALPASKLESLVRFYLTICQEAVSSLSDGTGHKPHYSLRTLCRALSVASGNPCGSIPRSLFEGLLLSFLTQLDRSSHPAVEEMVMKAVTGKNSTELRSLLKQPIPAPVTSGNVSKQIEGYWITQGSLEPHIPDKYIMTKTVRQNLRDLVRIVSLARLPVLLQGETSVGKTSLITFLAQASGNRCLRINNHEHTDLQEYIGCYSADERGNLVFKEGVLVEAMKFGYWVILDELNLAPSDVLEALNRVLDDNRELFIPETQKVVKAHPNFMLFATQNPPGLYGGRKVLSRAFRNRFIELHFDEIPPQELETILHLRCDMPLSYCKKMVAVMSDLQVRRRGSAAFAGKQGFITLRDLFRWGERYRLAQQVEQGKYYDWDQHIADEGYLILAGRVRKEEERVIIQEALKKHIRRAVDPERLFTLGSDTSPVTRCILESILNLAPPGFCHIVWTYNMRRLAVLIGKACEFKEPILLVGETGCGKTTMCQFLAASKNQNLATINCHMHSESADFLGSLRPVRTYSEDNKGKLFEWVDGPLIETMMSGGVFLADEISLADDSVLERLNSLLEPERKLLLTEKGSDVSGQPCEITAQSSFIFVGTMNPGGDFGKKELSPALRNRFTEVWCDGCVQRDDLIAIINHNLRHKLTFKNEYGDVSVGSILLDFLEWFSETELGNRFSRSVRDIMTWVDFINVCTKPSINLDLGGAYIHGACLTFLDGLGTGLTSSISNEAVYSMRVAALEFLRNQVKKVSATEPASLESFMSLKFGDCEVQYFAEKFGMHPFYIPRGNCSSKENDEFLLSAPTTRVNAMRVLRSLQLDKALLLEGSPGVGKTSIVSALARAAGYKLTRINLSDQTDISDLFGADLPVEGGLGGEFAWRDGPFLQALKAGHWILLDELNLASQSVLEGLNAVLDHRGELFIPELGRTFHIQSRETRLFACQNPLNQGGARKGLPQSFLNRFTQVYMEALTSDDLEYICHALYPTLPLDLIKSMVLFNQRAALETAPGGKWGQRGAPWEMNLRDLSRWCEITAWGASNGALNPGRFVQLLYCDRLRTLRDKEEMKDLYLQFFADKYPLFCNIPLIHVSPSALYVGDVVIKRGSSENLSLPKLLLRKQLPTLQSLARCVSLNWLSILVGHTGCGKTSLVHLLAQLAGQELKTLAVNSAMDTTEILGGFEQADYKRHLDELSVKVNKIMRIGVQNLILTKREKESFHLLNRWEAFVHSGKISCTDRVQSVKSEIKAFSYAIELLVDVISSIPKTAVSSDNLEELNLLKTQLLHLNECCSRECSMNAGGKFEWIDSVLVKCLKDGCWLLVDNVNLCSAAVLDRLNGLLEPNGVLSVNERGVDQNGELVTIRPHPDFRLFFTMDPKYGEISRAMRNRGIEIHVTTCEGDFVSSMSRLDLAALLCNIGVYNQFDQQLLVTTHQKMLSVIQGPDLPGVTELLHASYLFIQQVQRGMPSTKSLLSSFTKVYILSRLCDSISIKQQNLSILEEHINQGLQGPCCSALDNLAGQSTLMTGEIYLDPCLSTVKQRCAVLSALSSVKEYDLVEILKFLGLKETRTNVDFNTVLVNLVIFYYQMCSVNDVPLATKWLKKEVNGAINGVLVGQISEVLHSELVSTGDLAACYLPWDRRWLPDVSHALLKLSGVEDQGVENRVALLLYITAHAFREKFCFDLKKLKQQQTISVLEYSFAVSKGVIADSLSSETIIVKISPFLDLTFNLMTEALNTIGVAVNDGQWWSLRRAFLWTRRYQKLVATLNLSSDKNSVVETLNLLCVYYRWFSKYTIPVVTSLSHEANLDCSSLREVIKKIDASVNYNNSELWCLAKRLRREFGQPLPIASKVEASLVPSAYEIGNLLNLWSKEKKKNFLQVVQFISTSEGLLAKASLIVAMSDIIGKQILDGVGEKLEQVQCACRGAGLFSSSSITEPNEPLPKTNLKTLLWPFLEAVCLYASRPLLLKLLQGQTVLSSFSEYSVFIQALKNTPSAPPALIGCFKALENENCRELHQGLLWLFRTSNHSLAVSNPPFWISCGLDFISNPLDFQENLPQHCPVLSQLASTLLFCHNASSKEQLVISSLEQHSERLNLFRSVRSLLWRNCGSFSSPYYLYRENEVKSVVAATLHFITKFETSCGIVGRETDTICERVTTVTNCLRIKLVGKASLLPDLLGLLSQLAQVIDDLKRNKPVHNEVLLQVGMAWAFLGCIESQLLSAFPKIDPTVKIAIKRQFATEEIVDLRSELLAAKMMASVGGSNPDCLPNHPHVVVLKTHLDSVIEKLSVLNSEVALRPEPSMYFTLTKEMQHLSSSLSSIPLVTRLTERLLSIHGNSSPSDCHAILKEAQTWLCSQQSFETMMESRFALWYPDIIRPLLASNAKLSRGIELMSGVAKKFYHGGAGNTDFRDLNKFLCSLGNFPTLGPKQPSIEFLLSNLSSRHLPFSIEQKLQAVVGETSNLQERWQTEAHWLLKSALLELKNFLCISQSCKSSEWNTLVKVLRSFVNIWEKQESERQKKEQDDESIYKSRGAVKCQTVSEDQERLNEIAEIFPSNRENDFGDLEPNNTLDGLNNKEKDFPRLGELSSIMDEDDVSLVSSVHISLALTYTKTAWIDPTNASGLNIDHLTPWIQRCAVAARLISLSSHILDDHVDKCLLPSWILASYLLASRSVLNGVTDSREELSYDFYRSSCVPEVKQCKPVLDALLKRINELLCEWPEHPTLNQMGVVVNRIVTFPIESPLARFLTGLEILLSKMQEWEENAHSGVSIASHLTAVTNLIIQWRRLELSCWKVCLNAAALKMQKKACRWWFYLFSLVDCFVHPLPEKNNLNIREILKSLQQFMEESPLGEFQLRLDMLLAFHCHVANMEVSSHQKELESVLWNLHKFYSQFKDKVVDRTNELRAPIEKKLKDYVKIARWNDISYWAVKDAVFKTQRTLHKHVKEFEDVLKQSVKSVLLTSQLEGQLQTQNQDLILNPSIYIANFDIIDFDDLSGLDTELDNSAVAFRSAPLFRRSRKLVKSIILSSTAPGRIAVLNEFANGIAESTQHLSTLEVDRLVPKSKQVSMAKNQLQMKRKALADLFRMLQLIGLSYQKGLTFEENHIKHAFTQLPPLDISVCTKIVNKTTGCISSIADQEILNAWVGCSSYLTRSWARYIQLCVAIRNPHKDHGPPNIERICGFPAHLLIMIHDQHKKVYECVNFLAQMQIHLFHLKSLKDFLKESLPSQRDLQLWDRRLQSLLVSSVVTLEQFRLLLDACTDFEASAGIDESIPIMLHDQNIISESLGALQVDISWSKALDIVTQALAQLKECQRNVDFECSNLPSGIKIFFTVSHFQKMFECFNNISQISDSIQKLNCYFKSENSLHPCLESLEWLRKHMRSECHSFFEMCQMSSSETTQLNVVSFPEISRKVNDLMFNVLLAIQKMYKDHTNSEESVLFQTSCDDLYDDVVDQKTEEMDVDCDLEEKHLSKGIFQTLQTNLDLLCVESIQTNLHTVLNDVFNAISGGGQSSLKDKTIRLALQLIPLLQQWVLLYQFVVKQQVAAYRASSKLLSILLAVFGNVAVKGFCMPEDLVSSEEVCDGEGQSDAKQDGSMGLGEGDGEKDVSERIESEDQLEDAQPSEEERKNEDKDCKEDNGIEMSENFDGKLQDLDPEGNKDDDEDGEDDNTDAEKEMGETDRDADRLDEQIWGSDSEEEGDEGEGNDEEEGNSGERTGEKEMGAREQDANENNKNDKASDGDENDKESTKPEINEMKNPDVDDDQIDPYHGNQAPEVEPDPLELPEDMQLDDGENKEKEDEDEGNPFDVDKMKDKMPPEKDQRDENKETSGEADVDKPGDEFSDDEDNDTGELAKDEASCEEEPAQDNESENSLDLGDKEVGRNLDGVEESKNSDNELEDEKNENEERNPSRKDPTLEQPQTSEDTPQGSMDQVASTERESQEASGEKPEEEADGDPGNDEKDAVGQAPVNRDMHGHHSNLSGKRPRRDQQMHQPKEEQKRQRPGHSDDQRSLGDATEPLKKRLKTQDMKQEDDVNDKESVEDVDLAADLFQHIKDVKEQSSTQTLDAATKEQADQQQFREEEAPPLNHDDEAIDIDNDETTSENCDQEQEVLEESLSGCSNEKQKEGRSKLPVQRETETLEKNIEVEGEKVDTLSVRRAPETTFHTQFEELVLPNLLTLADIEEQSETVRQDLQNQLASWNVKYPEEEASKAWQSLSSLTNSLARDLSEQLRLVLEPTQATRMKGDFRTGRRINMRKVIPYIASQFRKDKIWMRRTKPSKREYQIVLAIDDSSSMADNRSKELAFESLALVSQALTLLEVGELGVLSFGEEVKVLHKLGEPFTQFSGARLLQQFSFEQKKTQIGILIDFATTLFTSNKVQTSADHAQLLVVISDGRGVFSEGQEKVCSCVRKARLAGIFLVFVIIDNPESKDSILDIRTPVFSGGNLLGISPYMDSFPFPFYLILRDISNLPAVLSDALRQWFELVSNME